MSMFASILEAALWTTVIFAVVLAMLGLAGITLFVLCWIGEGIYKLYKWLAPKQSEPEIPAHPPGMSTVWDEDCEKCNELQRSLNDWKKCAETLQKERNSLIAGEE